MDIIQREKQKNVTPNEFDNADHMGETMGNETEVQSDEDSPHAKVEQESEFFMQPLGTIEKSKDQESLLLQSQ